MVVAALTQSRQKLKVKKEQTHFEHNSTNEGRTYSPFIINLLLHTATRPLSRTHNAQSQSNSGFIVRGVSQTFS